MVSAKTDTGKIPFYDMEDEAPEIAAMDMYIESRKTAMQAKSDSPRILETLKRRVKRLDNIAEQIEAWAIQTMNNDLLEAIQLIRSGLGNDITAGIRLFRIIEKLQAADSNAQAVIQGQLAVIDTIANEIESLKSAIEQGDTTDLRLAPVVERLREYIEADAQYTGRMAADLERISEMAHYIRYLTNMPDSKAFPLATRLSFLLDGTLENSKEGKINAKERAAYIALLKAMEV